MDHAKLFMERLQKCSVHGSTLKPFVEMGVSVLLPLMEHEEISVGQNHTCVVTCLCVFVCVCSCTAGDLQNWPA